MTVSNVDATSEGYSIQMNAGGMSGVRLVDCAFGLVFPPVSDVGRRFCLVALWVARLLVCSRGGLVDDPLCCPVRLLALAVVDVASLVVVQEHCCPSVCWVSCLLDPLAAI